MKYLVAIAICVLALSGCTTIVKVNEGLATVSESKQLDKLCQLRPLAMQAYNLLKVQVSIKPVIEEKVIAANKVLRTICTNRPSNIIEALVTATEAYRSILDTTESLAVNVKDDLT